MDRLTYYTPFDVLVKSFFNSNEEFLPASSKNTHHPVDIYEDKTGLHIEVACTGLSKDEIQVTIENQLVRIKYDKQDKTSIKDQEELVWYSNGISKRAFNLGYKIAPRFNTSKAEGRFANGLLIIDIPFAEESKPKPLTLK